jgi:Pyruvate/2-oxoacid:ferredoxin oxidoreductase gamma subunit
MRCSLKGFQMMTDVSKAWVWASYQGVVEDISPERSTHKQNQSPAEDRVVPFRTVKNSRSEAMGQNSTRARTKFGLAIAISIMVGAFFKLIALALFLIAVLLVVSGREPQKTQEFLANLPGGNHIIKALARVDGWLS